MYNITIPANSTGEFYIPTGYNINKVNDVVKGDKVPVNVFEQNNCKLQAGNYKVVLNKKLKNQN